MENARLDHGALSTADHRSTLVIHVGAEAYAFPAAGGPVVIGREHPAQVQIPHGGISKSHLRIEEHNGHWTGIDQSSNGVFVNGQRRSTIDITDGLTIHLGHPEQGIAVRFTIDGAHIDDPDVGLDETSERDAEETANITRAGQAVAARREELRISQRKLAQDKVINAGALIAFEKGRSWPRASTRARLEQVLQWPPGTIERLRDRVDEEPDRAEMTGGTTTIEARFMAEAVEVALGTINSTIADLPEPSDPDFNYRAAGILADLRKLETVAAKAAKSTTGAPNVVLVLSQIRHAYRELMLRAAEAPNATLGQRLFAARHRADLSIDETATAAGVTPEVIAAAEADAALAERHVGAIEHLISALPGPRR
ncbi:forkhead-associated protein [Mycolicibacterium fortuitum]|uniref:Forkhead-associated protein n=1 Tax=Mycolicibacterium fortuitum TaxID=1766 RepID=A0A378WEU2_MYCFO|nr:forkhead-associated protein [Mycolicibacterium fortuitum]